MRRAPVVGMLDHRALSEKLAEVVADQRTRAGVLTERRYRSGGRVICVRRDALRSTFLLLLALVAACTPTPGAVRMTAPVPARRDVTFRAASAELHGWLYVPDAPPKWPLVVMSHGFSATRSMTADVYAERFRAAGLAVLLYDHRGFGESGGTPRRQLNPWVQAREYVDAIDWASRRPDIDDARIALWGDSFSGGVALAVAGVDRRVSALVAQVPAIGSDLPPDDPDGARARLLAATILAGPYEPSSADEVEGPLPVVSDDQTRQPSALTPITAYRWFSEYGGRSGSGWVNEITRARPKTAAPWQPALCASLVTAPTQFLVAPDDEMKGARPEVSRAAFERLRGKEEWVVVEGGHFGLLYVPSSEFEHAVREQTRFLTEHLLLARSFAAAPPGAKTPVD